MAYTIEAPADVPEYAWPAWFSCLQWAIGKAEIRQQFAEETGHVWSPALCAIDLMIDDATGWREDYMRAFVTWFNSNIWGEWEGKSEVTQ